MTRSHLASRHSFLLAFLGVGAFASPMPHVAVPGSGHGPAPGVLPLAARTRLAPPDVTAAGTVSNAKNVTGTVTQHAPPFPSMPVVTCPTGGYTPSVPQGSGITYNPATGVLKVSSTNLTLPAPPNQYYFHQVVLSGG